MKRLLMLATCIVALVLAGVAAADSAGPITFEAPTYTTGDINGQDGWMKTNAAFDVAVADVSLFPAASGYGFGDQALRLSDAYTSGSFGDQTFSPGLLSPAGESDARHFDASFRIGTTLATEQTGLSMSVSPDNGQGARMSYLRFEDHADGVDVFFADATDPGPLSTAASFSDTKIATLSRASAHTIRFLINFKTGPGNDDVKIFVDGKKLITGTTWEDYYRYDPEQTGGGNVVPTVSKMLFRFGGTAHPGNVGNGFLVDDLSLMSSAP